MSAQEPTPSSTAVQRRQSEQQGALARRSSITASQALWLDPFEIFNAGATSLFKRMQNEMTRAFGSSGSGSSIGRGDQISTMVWVPAIEVAEQDGNLVVSAELPGLTDEDVTVEISDDAIVIQGERQMEHEEAEGGARRTERRYGQFYRVIPLPDGADPEKARAEFVNGVLQITVPLEGIPNNTRKIPIQAASTTQPASKSTDEQRAAGESSKSSESPATQKAA